jgi:hypothetical protein
LIHFLEKRILIAFLFPTHSSATLYSVKIWCLCAFAQLLNPMQGTFISFPSSAHLRSPLQGIFISFRTSSHLVRTVLILVLIQVVLSILTPMLMTFALRSHKVSFNRAKMIDPQGGHEDTVANAPLVQTHNKNSKPELKQVSITPQSVQVLRNALNERITSLEFQGIVMQPVTTRIQLPDLEKATDIRLGDTDSFRGKMEMAGIPFHVWIDVKQEFVKDIPWVQHTAAWWNLTDTSCMSENTLRDMGLSHNDYYRTLSKAFSDGKFTEAAKLFSPFQDGLDEWPGIAVFANAVVFDDGQVHNGSFVVQAKSCGSHSSLNFPAETPQSFHVVATIAHFWGSGYYHFVAENLVRVPLILQVIQDHKYSKLHIQSRHPFVEILLSALGVQTDSIIQGTVRANLLLLPEPVPCGNPPAVMLHLLRRTLLEKNVGFHASSTSECQVLIVKRKGSRAISNHDDLRSRLSTTYPLCHIAVHTGDENVLDQLKLFRSSTIIVAPHGAGLSNIIACREQTLILELMVEGRDVNICYMAMAYKLKLRHIALTVNGATHTGAMTVDLPRLTSLLELVCKKSYCRKSNLT